MSVPTRTPAADACSSRALHAAEPLAGTAPERWGWLAVEQPGPWGPRGWVDSHLPPGIDPELPDTLAERGLGVLLIRRPGRHADLHRPGPRTLLFADTRPSTRRLRQLVVADGDLASTLGAFDVDAVAEGAVWGEATAEQQVLVCTHARRDRCCALLGRDLLDGVLRNGWGDGPVALWESSHLGGHRFAGTALVLPSGVMLGRAQPSDVRAALTGSAPTVALRGRTYLSRPEQAADAAVAAHGVHAVEPRRVTGTGQDRFIVEDHQGQTWNVTLDRLALPDRPLSCGADDEGGHALLPRSVIPAS
jgi:hypothetical protein